MAGKIVADTLEHSTDGSIATSYVVDGTNKAWAIIDTNTATTATTGAMNVSGVTDNGTGDFTLAWSASMNSTPYAFSNGVYNNAGDAYVRAIHVRGTGITETTPAGMTTSNCRFVSAYSGVGGDGATGYQAYSCINIQGDLS